MGNSSNPNQHPMRITPRDAALLEEFWRTRELFIAEVRVLAFDRSLADRNRPPHRSVAYRRLAKAVRNGLLTARRVPAFGSAGACPLLYTLGPHAVPLLAAQLALSEEYVRRRITADTHLSEHFREHRQGITRAYVALKQACRGVAYDLDWESDEDLARRSMRVSLDGVTYPIRPDARLTLTIPNRGHTCCFIEVQRTSRPSAFQVKLRGYVEGWRQELFVQQFGFATPRVLGLTESESRARNLQQAAEAVGNQGLVWATTLDALANDPFGAHWYVAGQGDERKSLLGG